jgi:hypothetical protein
MTSQQAHRINAIRSYRQPGSMAPSRALPAPEAVPEIRGGLPAILGRLGADAMETKALEDAQRSRIARIDRRQDLGEDEAFCSSATSQRQASVANPCPRRRRRTRSRCRRAIPA